VELLEQCTGTYTAVSRKVVGKSARDNPEGIVGGFEFTVLQRNLKELARKAMKMCLRVLTERNKSRFDSYSRQEVYRSYPILTFGIVACTFFSTTFLEIAVKNQGLVFLNWDS